jgi:hypothetical protein
VFRLALASTGVELSQDGNIMRYQRTRKYRERKGRDKRGREFDGSKRWEVWTFAGSSDLALFLHSPPHRP